MSGYFGSGDAAPWVKCDDGLYREPPRKTGVSFLIETPHRLVSLEYLAGDAERPNPACRWPFAVTEEDVAGFDAVEHTDAVAASTLCRRWEPAHSEALCLGLRPRLQSEDVRPVRHRLILGWLLDRCRALFDSLSGQNPDSYFLRPVRLEQKRHVTAAKRMLVTEISLGVRREQRRCLALVREQRRAVVGYTAANAKSIPPLALTAGNDALVPCCCRSAHRRPSVVWS